MHARIGSKQKINPDKVDEILITAYFVYRVIYPTFIFSVNSYSVFYY